MPIRNAPPGSKCVRCPCNCLLICKSSSQHITCPKPDCKRIINLAPGSTPPVLSMPSSDMYWVGCAYCHDSFLFNTSNNALARCPHCCKLSSVGPSFARRRWIAYIITALAYAIGATAQFYRYIKTEKTKGTDFTIYIIIVVFSAAFFCLVRSIYFCTIKVSLIEEALVLKNNNEEPP